MYRVAIGSSYGRCPNGAREDGLSQRSRSHTSQFLTNADTLARTRGHQNRCDMRRNVDSYPWCAGKCSERMTSSRRREETTTREKIERSFVCLSNPDSTTRWFHTLTNCSRSGFNSILATSGFFPCYNSWRARATVILARFSASQSTRISRGSMSVIGQTNEGTPRAKFVGTKLSTA